MKKALNDRCRARFAQLAGAVVDLGCGSRAFEPDIHRHATSYSGVDWSNSLRGKAADIVADLNGRPPIGDAAFDHVVSFEVLDHLAERRIILKLKYQTLRLLRGPVIVRAVGRAVLVHFWWAGQHAAGLLNGCWPDERETAGCFMTAVKP